MNDQAQQIIDQLGLQPHPEGGYYKETYLSTGRVSQAALPDTFSGSRPYSTCIYFMLTSENFSAFHRIQQDEIWHFYDGAAITLHILSPDGNYENHRIGRDISAGERPQIVVPAGHWFAAEIIPSDSFALVGCTVAPGFNFADFTLGTRRDLATWYPKYEQLITRLTRQ